MRILLVEDDLALANTLKKVLKDESYAVDHAEDGQEGEWLACENDYDLIVLDLMLPIKSGYAVLKEIRAQNIHTPVLILTAKGSKEDTVEGLDLGADDYMAKPFSVDELLARIRALLRRKSSQTAGASLIAGPITVIPSKKQVLVNGESVELTAKEYAIVEYFARNPDTVISRSELSDHVWDMNFDSSSNVIDVYIGYLRNKIDKAIGMPVIKTVRGHGYILETGA